MDHIIYLFLLLSPVSFFLKELFWYIKGHNFNQFQRPWLRPCTSGGVEGVTPDVPVEMGVVATTWEGLVSLYLHYSSQLFTDFSNCELHEL